MTRIKGWLAKIWRKILLFFSAMAVALTALAVPLFADTASYASGTPFVFGDHVFSLAVNPSTDNFNYKWMNNDTTGGSGTYAFQSVQYLNSSLPTMAGDYWKFSHTFADNHGYQINGTISLPYRGLPYFENAEAYYLKFAMGFSTLSNLGSGWLSATLRFYNASDVRLGEVYTMTKITSVASFAIQTQVPAFTEEVKYMTLQFSGYGSSSAELYIDQLYFSTLTWSVQNSEPVISTDLEVPPYDPLDDYISDFSSAVGDTNENITAVQDLLTMGGYSTSLNMQDLQPLIRPIQAYSTFLTGWWNLDSTFRVVICFMIGAIVLATFAGIVAGFVRKGKG